MVGRSRQRHVRADRPAPRASAYAAGVVTLLVAWEVLSCMEALVFRTGFRVTGTLCVIAATITLVWGFWVGAVLLA